MVDLSLAPLQTLEASTKDPAALSQRLQQQGYLFVRGLIDPENVGRLRSDIRQLLIRYGFTVDDPEQELKWSGRMPESNELTPSGRIGRMIGELPSLTEVIHDRELFRFLGTLFDGEVFSWVENADRVRVMFQDLEPADTGGQRFDYATPAHQDGYHFRVSFVTCWVALMDIDLATGGLAVRKGSHREGIHQHWYRGSRYLGIPQNPDQARQMARIGAVSVAGDTAPDDSPKTWLRSDYRAGDVLIFHPHMMHRGLPNRSRQLRVSGDFRYQRRGDPTVWQAGCRLFQCHKFLDEFPRLPAGDGHRAGRGRPGLGADAPLRAQSGDGPPHPGPIHGASGVVSITPPLRGSRRSRAARRRLMRWGGGSQAARLQWGPDKASYTASSTPMQFSNTSLFQKRRIPYSFFRRKIIAFLVVGVPLPVPADTHTGVG